MRIIVQNSPKSALITVNYSVYVGYLRGKIVNEMDIKMQLTSQKSGSQPPHRPPMPAQYLTLLPTGLIGSYHPTTYRMSRLLKAPAGGSCGPVPDPCSWPPGSPAAAIIPIKKTCQDLDQAFCTLHTGPGPVPGLLSIIYLVDGRRRDPSTCCRPGRRRDPGTCCRPGRRSDPGSGPGIRPAWDPVYTIS